MRGYHRGIWLRQMRRAGSDRRLAGTGLPEAQTNRPPAVADGRLVAVRLVGARRLRPSLQIEGLALRLTVGRRGRTRAVLRHELVELFLVLGVTQPVEEILEFGLLLFEAL
jgi:hypothetical protein